MGEMALAEWRERVRWVRRNDEWFAPANPVARFSESLMNDTAAFSSWKSTAFALVSATGRPWARAKATGAVVKASEERR